MPRAVLDSTILVSAFLAPKGLSAELLNQAVRRAFDLRLSEAIIQETRLVLLTRRHLRKRFRYSEQEVEEFCVLLQGFARIVTDVPSVQVSRDSSDDMVLACAVKAQAQYLVTRDKDLLSLESYQDTQVISPENFAALLRK